MSSACARSVDLKDIDGDWFLKGGVFEVARFERRQEANLAVWRRKARATWPRIAVAESNCGKDKDRAEWFAMLTDYLGNHGGGEIITYWQEPGRLRQGSGTGPWPPSKAVIGRLRYLSELYGGHHSSEHQVARRLQPAIVQPLRVRTE
jgi:hypothetical protein